MATNVDPQHRGSSPTHGDHQAPQPLFSPEFLRIMTVWSVIPMYLVFGGLLGWGADYLFHTWPFGVAIGLLAGLVFAVRDSMRLRKEFHRPKEPTDGAAG